MTQHHEVQTQRSHKERLAGGEARSSSLPVSRNAGGQIYQTDSAAYHAAIAENNQHTPIQAVSRSPVRQEQSHNTLYVWSREGDSKEKPGKVTPLPWNRQ